MRVVMQVVLRALMLFSLATLAFIYGFLCHEYRLFPFHHLRNAHIASKAIVEVAQMPSPRMPDAHLVKINQPTVIRHATTAASPYVLVSAGGGMKLPGIDHEVMAWIIDRSGRVVHSWKAQPELWRDLKMVRRVTGISGAVSPAGFHLFPDGSLLATFHGENTFPFAVGIAKFDRDANLLWSKELLAHHFFSLNQDGHIFVPAMEVVDSPLVIGNTAAQIETYKSKIYLDQIVELDADGHEIDRVSILKILCDSGRHGLLTQMNTGRLEHEDPTHLNDVQVLDEQDAQALPGTDAGDLLISLRNLNTLAVVDRHTKLIKWCSSGTTIGQHSPRRYRQGILAFDNLGGDAQLGGTRLVHIDYLTGQPQTLFPRPGVEMPDVCRTTYSGHIDLHRDDRHALMCITNSGALWEVDLDSGKVVWEYLVNDPRQPQLRAGLGYACYVDELFARDNDSD